MSTCTKPVGSQSWNRYSYVSGRPTRFVDPNGTMQFEVDEYAGTLGAGAVEKAEEEQEKLRKSLSRAVKAYYQNAFGVDLDKLLSKGQGPTVKLSSNADPFFQGQHQGAGRYSNGEFKLNLSEHLFDFSKGGVTLFQATLLHESAHWALDELGLKRGSEAAGPDGDWVRKEEKSALEKLQSISPSTAWRASKDPVEGHAAEIYQWGDIISLAIGNW